MQSSFQLLLLLLFSLNLCAQCDHTGQIIIRDGEERVLYQEQVYRTADIERVKDHVFARGAIDWQGEPVDLAVDLYYPKLEFLSDDACGTRPVVFYFHAGGYVVGDKASWEKTGLYFAQRGYVFASVNYRLTCPTAINCPYFTCACGGSDNPNCWLDCSTCPDDEGCFHCGEKDPAIAPCNPASGCWKNLAEFRRAHTRAIQDGWACLRHVLALDSLAIDTGAVFLGGSSAGGSTALALAYMDDDQMTDFVLDEVGGILQLQPEEPYLKRRVKIAGLMIKSGAIGVAESGPVKSLETLVDPEEMAPLSVFHGTCEAIPFRYGWADFCDPSTDAPSRPLAFYLHGARSIADRYDEVRDGDLNPFYEIFINCNEQHQFSGPPGEPGWHAQHRAEIWVDFTNRVMSGAIEGESSYMQKIEFPGGWNQELDSCVYYSECWDVCTGAALDCGWGAGIRTVFGEYDIAIQPNPTTGKFTVFFDSKTEQTSNLEIFNVAGQRIYQAWVPVVIGYNQLEIRLIPFDHHQMLYLRIDGGEATPFAFLNTARWSGRTTQN